MEMNYASNGKGNLGVTLGAIGTGLAAMQNGGILGNLFGNGNGYCSDDRCVNRYELGLIQSNTDLKTENALLKADKYTDQKFADFADRMNDRFRNVEQQLAAQAVHNATSDAVLGCMQGQIAQLMSLSKLVIPNTSVCPGWGNVTVTPAAAATT